MNISTTNAPIKNRTNRDDSLRCSILSANGIKKVNWFCVAGCEMNVMGWGGVLDDSSVNTLTTKASIKNRTSWGDSLRCSILSANGIKKVNWFCIAGCEIIVMGWGGALATRRCGRIPSTTVL